MKYFSLDADKMALREKQKNKKNLTRILEILAHLEERRIGKII